MYNLIPHFIENQHQRNQDQGSFTGAVLFMDISGFASMTDQLMVHGKVGGEVLSNILTSIFDPVIHAVYDRGGYITSFAGDAFTAVFPRKSPESGETDDTALTVCHAARVIRNVFGSSGHQITSLGEFHLQVKIGIAYGKVFWAIAGPASHKTYYYNGPVIDGAAEAEHRCSAGEIVLDSNLVELLSEELVKLQPRGEHYFILTDMLTEDDEPDRYEIPNLALDTALSFFPENLLLARQSGEFRDVASVFISFDSIPNHDDFDRFISSIINLIDRYDGYFNRVNFGDKGGNILIFFGAPVAHENDLERALDFLLDFNRVLGSEFAVRAGIDYGRMFAGMIGIPERCEYSTLGNVVNFSARLMMNAEWGELLIPESLSHHAEYQFSLKGHYRYKGFQNEIGTYRVMGKKSGIEHQYSDAFVGREEELNQLSQLCIPVFQRKNGGIVYLDGAAGMGKTRLIHELRNYLNVTPDIGEFIWLYLPCEEILRKSFNPFIYFLKNYFHQSDQTSPEDNRSNFEKGINDLIERTRDESIQSELIRTQSILGALLNLFRDNSLYERLDARSRFENTLYAVKNLIKAESLIQPVIIEVEDGHWIDPESIKLLEILTRNAETAPFIILTTCRYHDDGSELTFHLPHIPTHRVKLESLDKSVAKELMQSFLPGLSVDNGIPEESFKFIFDKAGGNPFYIEQICLYLTENDLLDTEMKLNEKAFDIPASINAVIISRIDRLADELKEIVKVSSVLGREFAVNVLGCVLNNKELTIHLLAGENENIWAAVSALQYLFKHALVHEAVYQMQLKSRLRDLHKLVADTIESIYEGNLAPHFFDLAEHFEKSETRDKTIVYLEKAATQAKEKYENNRAIECYSRLINHLDQEKADVRKCEALENRGVVYRLIGEMAPAKSDFEMSLDLAVNLNDKLAEAAAENALGGIETTQGRPDSSLSHYKKSLELYRELSNREGEAVAYHNIGNIHLSRSEFSEASRYYEQSLVLKREVGDIRGEGETYNNLAVLNLSQSRFDEALNLLEKSLKKREESGDLKGRNNSISNMGRVYSSRGMYEKALECFQDGLTGARAIGDLQAESLMIMNVGTIQYSQGRFHESIESFTRALEINEELGDATGTARAIHNIGTVFYDQGKHQSAREYFENALNIRRSAGDRHGIVETTNNLGLIHYESGRYDLAEKYAEECLALRTTFKDQAGIADSYINLGKVSYARFDYENALDLYRKALEIKKSIEDLNGEGYVQNNTGDVYFCKSEFEKAEDLYSKAIRIFKKTGDQNWYTLGLMNFAKIHFVKGNFQKALELCEKSLNIRKEQGHLRGLAFVYHFLGQLYFAMNNLDKSLEYYNSAGKINTDVQDLQGLGFVNHGKGNCTLAGGDLKRALSCFEKAMNFRSDLGQDHLTVLSRSMAGRVHLLLGDYETALELSTSALNWLDGFDPLNRYEFIEPEQIYYTHHLILKANDPSGSDAYLARAADILTKRLSHVTDPDHILNIQNMPLIKPITSC